MKKVLVTYYSETGNTEKVARAIYDALSGTEKQIASLADGPDPAGFDLIFVGFPVIASTVPGKAEVFLKRLTEKNKVAVFATHGSLRGGMLAKTAFEYAATLPQGAKILGTFGSRGKVKSKVLEAASKNAEYKAWAEEAASAATHPNEADFTDAAEFAEKMLTLAG